MKHIEISIGYWDELKTPITYIRTKVFIEEQGIPADLEWEAADKQCIHALAKWEQQAVGTARLLDDGTIGRLAVLPQWRHRGIGSDLLITLLEKAQSLNLPVKLHAQVAVMNFYRRLGFRAIGNTFYEAGIEHQTMVFNKDNE